MRDRSEETRERILQSAMKLFADNGFDATGVAEICERSELSKGAFYHHFPSKQAVFLELLNSWLDGLDRDLISSVERSDVSVPQALLEMARRTHEVFEVADGRLPLFLEFWSQARKDPEVWTRTVAPFRRYRDLFAGIIRRGVEEKSFKEVDADMAASAMVSLAVGILLQGVVDPEGSDWAKVMVSSIELLLDGLRR